MAELVPEIIAWARGPLAAIHGDSLDDPRVTLRQGDVGNVIGRRRSESSMRSCSMSTTAPKACRAPGNDALYSHAGIARAKAALRPGGVLLVWSVAPDQHFTRRLQQSGMRSRK